MPMQSFKHTREFDVYQGLSAESAVYPGRGTDDPAALMYPVLGLNGEAGEVAELFKKAYRAGEPIDRDKLRSELGDVLWYLSEIAEIAGLSLTEVAEDNLAKLKGRRARGEIVHHA